MGFLALLHRRSTAGPPDTAWRPDGTGVVTSGDCGGDIQAGESWSVRFIRPDKPGSLLTVTFYPVEYDECPGEFVMQRKIEWMVCADPADPGGTEIWPDEVVRDDPMDPVFATAAEADARATAEDALLRADAYGCWDGEPDWNGAA
jgi:hypothetical protein